MKFRNLAVPAALLPCAFAFPHLENYPRYRSLSGLSDDEVRYVARQYGDFPGAQPLPQPISYTGPKLSNDADHPFEELRPGDIRGPCPGLNTLASHGYLNRNGVVTPAEIITAVQEGFNLAFHFATFLCYQAFVTDGNHLTNMMTIGSNLTVNGQLVTGIDTHGNFEGDGSITRQDIFFGDPISFNQASFDVLVEAANTVGGGAVTIEASGYDRALRTNMSIANNPEFFYQSPRYPGAFTESLFIVAMFHSNQTVNVTEPLTLDEANHFFNLHKFPDNFFRRPAPFDFPQIGEFNAQLFDIVGILPGHNEGVNNYIVDETDDRSFCTVYHRQVNRVAALYPNPLGQLRDAIKANLNTFYMTLGNSSCEQYFPYGM